MSYRCLAPATIGRLTLSNRVIFPAMTMGFCDDKGFVTPKLVNFHLSRARGGAGLVTLEGAVVRPDGKGFAGQFCLYGDDAVPGLRGLVQALHKVGVKVAVQLFHAGRFARSDLTGCPVVAPSPLAFADSPVTGLTEESLDDLVQSFAAAAARACEAGVDAVEVNAGHGYLLQQFHSRFTNHRTDAYGGSLENRARCTVRVLRAVRQRLADGTPLILQLGVEEPVPDGLTLDEGIALAKHLVTEGVDALQVTAGLREVGMWITPPVALPQALHADRAGAIRDAIGASVPIITVGRIKSLELADDVIATGKADFVALGRALLADSYLPRKTQSGFRQRVRPCIGCNGCIDRLMHDLPVTCSVNPFVGHEGEENLILPSEKPLHVVIAGGGPGGIVAACALRHKGHRVTLLEKSARLGGNLYTAALASHRTELREYAEYLAVRATEMGVDIRYECEATVQSIRRLRPHVVIVAVGARPFVPDVPGLDATPFQLAADVLQNGAANVADRVVILGGELVGCELAEFLARKGCQVTLVEPGDGLALDMEPRSRDLLLERFKAMGVVAHVNTALTLATPERLELISPEGPTALDAYGTLALATGFRPDAALRRELVCEGFSVIEVGDCLKPGKIMDVIAQGVSVIRML